MLLTVSVVGCQNLDSSQAVWGLLQITLAGSGLSCHIICSHLSPLVLFSDWKLFWGRASGKLLFVVHHLLQLGSWPLTVAFKYDCSTKNEQELVNVS